MAHRSHTACTPVSDRRVRIQFNDVFPYELVAKIFEHAIKRDDFSRHYFADDSVEHYFPSGRINIGTLWILSRVCRKWWEVCKTHAKLWVASINADRGPVKVLRRYEKRTKNLPLVIESDSNMFPRDPKCMDFGNWGFALHYIENWGAFSFSRIGGSIQTNRILAKLKKPAHRLEMFQINFKLAHERDAVPLVLPQKLFLSEAPSLRRFALSNVDLQPSFDFSIFAPLTELYVDFDATGNASDKINARQWLAILREMKQLEYLTLAWTYKSYWRKFFVRSGESPIQDPSVLGNHPEVRLDCLRKLTLVATAQKDTMRSIFSKLVVPATCSTSVTIACYYDVPSDWLKMGLDRRAQRWNRANIPFHINLLSDGLTYNGIRQRGFRVNYGHRPRKNSSGHEAFEFRGLDYTGCSEYIYSRGVRPDVLVEQALRDARHASSEGHRDSLPEIKVDELPAVFTISQDSFFQEYSRMLKGPRYYSNC